MVLPSGREEVTDEGVQVSQSLVHRAWIIKQIYTTTAQQGHCFRLSSQTQDNSLSPQLRFWYWFQFACWVEEICETLLTLLLT